MTVGFVGLGAMGGAMAGHAARAGFEVLAHDVDAARLAEVATGGIRAAGAVADLAACETVVVMVADDDQSRSVTTALLAAGMAQGSVLAVAATIHPRTAIELAGFCAPQGVGFVDAPVCYGRKGAEDGNLVSLCGGTAKDVAQVTPLLLSYSRSVEHLGPVGCGLLGKTCNNMMHWAACVANYEVLLLAKACGIDAQAMRETLLKCPARNTTLERWDSTRFTWHQKDMDVALDLSQQADLSLPLFGAVDQLVKRLGPDMVRQLLHGDGATYLGQNIAPRPLHEIVGDP